MSEQPAVEVRNISWNNFLLSDENYLGKWRTDSGVRVTPETSLQSTVVLSCCRLLAETISALPIHLYRRLPDGSDEVAREVPLYKVLTFRPNEWQTKQEFFEQMMMSLTLWGNSYTSIKSGKYGSVSCLDNLHPSRMEVERLENGRLRYSYTDPESGRLERYTQDQIMHVRWTPEQDGIKGMVPVEIAREAIGLARACEQHAARFWANSARPGVVLTTDGALSAESAQQLRENFERLHRGADKSYRTAVLTGGLKVTELGFTNESSQFTASRSFQTEEIARVYRCPLHLIQGTPGGDLEVQGQEFITYTLMPWMSRIESAISRSLIYDDDQFHAKFDSRGLLRANSNTRAGYYSTMINLGIFSINEARSMEGMKSLGPSGDHHFVAMNTQTLEDATKPKPEAPPFGGGGGGGGPPPPTPGGPPSLSEVKTGAAPIASPVGEGSKPADEEAIEESSVDWEDAIEGRAFIATGDVKGVDKSVDAGDERLKQRKEFTPTTSSNYDFSAPPTEEQLVKALVGSGGTAKGTKIGKASDIPAGTKVAVRIDIPAFNWSAVNLDKPVYAVTVHEDKGGKQFGSPLAYETMVRLDGEVTFAAKETEAIKIATGESSKFPLATVKGSFDPSKDIPEDINSWTPVGYDPKKAAYFFDKRSGREVNRGTDAVSVGSTVFVRIAQYGDRAVQHQYRSANSWGIETRTFCATGEGNGVDNSCGSESGAGIDHSWKESTSPYSYKPSPGTKSPVRGGEDIKEIIISDPVAVADVMNLLGISDLTHVLSLTGGLSRGASTSVTARGVNIEVDSSYPISPNSGSHASMESTVSVGLDHEGEKYVDFANLHAATTVMNSGGNYSPSLEGENAKRVGSLLLEKFPEALAAAEKIGCSYAKTYAAGAADRQYNGYRLWPQFGFNAPLEDRVRSLAPGSETIQQLISTPEGDKLWNEHGNSAQMRLDFTDKKSLGYKKYQDKLALSKRLKKRNEGRSLSREDQEEIRTFCATGEGGGVLNSSCGVTIEQIATKIAASPDGFTLSPISAEQPTSGIMVSEFSNDSQRSVKIKASEIRSVAGLRRLSQWYADNSDLLVGQPNRFIGGWKTGEDYYIDVATRFEPSDAAAALDAGRAAGQLALFNLETFKETWVDYSNDDRKPAGYDRAFATARKDLQTKQVYDQDSPAIQEEDWAKELSTHGRTTVREYNGNHEHPTIRHPIEADHHRGLPRNAGSLRESGSSRREVARPSVVRRRSGVPSTSLEGSAGKAENRDGVDCGRAAGGIFGPGNNCQEDAGGGVAEKPISWKRSPTVVRYSSSDPSTSPPAKSLSEVGSATILNGKALSATLKDVGVTLDQAAKVCAPLKANADVMISHGPFSELEKLFDDPTTEIQSDSTVTFVSKVEIAGIDEAASIVTSLSRDEDDELHLNYHGLMIAPEAKEKASTAVGRELYRGVIDSINQSEKIGVDYINMLAAGSEGDSEFQGYKIWPRLGFDGPIPRSIVTPRYSLRLGIFEPYGSSIPSDILSPRAAAERAAGELTIQSLYETKGGQDWWEKNGGSMDMSLSPGDTESPGWNRFKKLSTRMTRRDIDEMFVESRAFCPTGEGNGEDNSCSSSGGTATAPAPANNTWRESEGAVAWNASDSAASPVSNSVKISSLDVDSAPKVASAMEKLGVSSLDDVVSLGGGFVRGASVGITSDGSTIHVAASWPIDRDGSTNESIHTTVSIGEGAEGKELGFETFGPGGEPVSSPEKQARVMSIISEKVAESISMAEDNGFATVSMFGVGDVDNEYKGYRLWPPFGFDGPISRELVRKIPAELVLKSKGVEPPAEGSSRLPRDIVIKSLASHLRQGLTVQELISTHEGKVWWNQNGEDIILTLDLTNKSSLGYKRWEKMRDKLPRLKTRNEDRSEQRAGSCGQDEFGQFMFGNDCADDNASDAFGGDVGGFERTPSAVKEKKGGGGGTEIAEPLSWSAGEPHLDAFRQSVENNPTIRSDDGKRILSTSIPGAVIGKGVGKSEVDPISVGRYLAGVQDAERGRVINTGDSKKPLQGEDFEYMVSAITDQVNSATQRGVRPDFYSPEDRARQLEEYAKIQPLMRGGITASGVDLGEPGPNGIAPNAEALFRWAQALTSPQANPKENMLRADQVITAYFTNPNPKTATLGNGFKMGGIGAETTHAAFRRLQGIIDTIGLDGTRELFNQPPMRAGDFQKYFDSKLPDTSGEKFKSKGYNVNEVVPVFSIFGPKVGTFYANNMGDLDPLTADVWFTRTWGRLSGELMREPSVANGQKHGRALMEVSGDVSRKDLAKISMDGRQFRTVVSEMKKTGTVPPAVIAWAQVCVKQYQRDGHPAPKNGGAADRYKVDRLATAIIENSTNVLNTPANGAMRGNMIKVMHEVSKRTGVPVAYMQDILWQDEQDVWGTLGSRTSTIPGVPSLYSDVMKLMGDGTLKRRPEKRSEHDLNDDYEYEFLSDEMGGIEQALYEVRLIDMSDEEFVKLAVSLVNIGEKTVRSQARDAVIEARSAGTETVVMHDAGMESLHVLGFDAEIPDDIVRTLPESLSHCRSIIELHVTDEGKAFWREYGRPIDVSISLKDRKSPQNQIFDRLTSEKRWKDILDEGILDEYRL